MKTLNLHVDYIKFKPLKKALKSVDELSEKEKKGGEVKDALAVLTAVEKTDTDVKSVVEKLVESIKEIAEQINVKNIVLYPYAHLSQDLASAELAIEVLEEAAKSLVKNKFNVFRAPFGYYKEFEMKVKGHPLSELSRSFDGGKEGEKIKVSEEMDKKVDIQELVKKLGKVKMSAERTKGGLKSNVELGRDLDLYLINEVVGSGLPLLTPKGATIKREIERFIQDEEIRRGYLYTSTPIMAKSDLYKISGHWDHYREFMFTLKVGNETFALRPMTCPFQFIIYKSKSRSYKELPIKYAEISSLFRNEKSGELMGLTRMRQFTLADAHIICKPEQLEEEFAKVIELVQYVMKTLKIEDIWYRFSKWDPKNKEKYIDNPKAWDSSQKSMKKILDKLKIKYVEAENEAAFYGPKLDLQYKNVFGKEDTLITVQIDFALPEKFDLNYLDKDNKFKKPIVIHRSSVGCLERTIAYLLEKTQGNLPLWLSPIQVKVLPMTDRNINYSRQIFDKLKKENIRVEIDDGTESMSKKVRDAQLEKVFYSITIGDKEEQAETLAIRNRDGKVEFGVKINDFVSKLKKEIKERI
ncbi:MAG: threonine--tRNA ligase [Candidatus Pacearchaeota archaeon]